VTPLSLRGCSQPAAAILVLKTEVRPVELSFYLVYVLAVTQLTHHLLDHLSLAGAGETLLLLLAVWAAWIYTTWVTNYFDPDTRPVRLMLLGVMLASLVMSAWIPEAFGDQGLIVAFMDSVALWWIYFDRAEEAGRRVIFAASDPGRLGVSALPSEPMSC
jgi:low temperature requirement protein LtrA